MQNMVKQDCSLPLTRYNRLHIHTQGINYACQLKKKIHEIFYYLMEVQNDCKNSFNFHNTYMYEQSNCIELVAYIRCFCFQRAFVNVPPRNYSVKNSMNY